MLFPLVEHLIRNVNVEESAKRSFKEFHAPGVTYVNLHFSAELVIKLYFFDPERIRHITYGMGDGWPRIVVNPHSHMYDFQTFVLAGSVTNFVYEKVEGGLHPGRFVWHEHRYYSPLRGEKRGSEYVGECNLYCDTSDIYRVGDRYDSRHDAIHNIRVSRSERTVLFLFQYRDKDKDYSSLFTPTPSLPDMEGLYQPMTPQEVEKLLKEVRV